MFEFFKKKWRSASAVTNAPSTPPPQPSARTAPGTEIHYHPDLIDQLKNDHQDLLGIFGGIKSSFEAGDYGKTAKTLADFRSALQGHLLTENVRLYIYLERCLSNDEMNYDLMRELRREMDGIGRTAMGFLKKYETIGIDKDLAASFAKDLDTIGSVLVQRINKEESVLYPLYMPNY